MHKQKRFKLFSLLALSLTTLLVMGGCGGGGGGGPSTPPPVAKTTISGAVTFPSITSLVSKRVGKTETDATITVQAYTIDGKVAGDAVHPSYDDEAATRVYSYSITNLEPGVDYVIKVTRGAAVLKKLIEKKDVVSGTLVGQNLDGVSSTAVIVASQKLGFTVGETLPTGKTVADTSSKISSDIKPVLLEGTISSIVGGSRSTLTASTVEYANLFNVVVSAINADKDPLTVIADPTLLSVSIFTADAEGTISTTTFTSVEDITPTYTAPTESAATYTAMAKNYLTAQDISSAALNYEKALTIDANDPEANFGGAITSGMMLMEDADVQAIITKWGAVVPTVNEIVQGTSPIKLPFDNLTSLTTLPKTTAKSVASATTATATQNVLAAFRVLKAKLPQQKTGFKSLAKELGLVPTTAPSIGEMQTLIDNVIIPRIDKINARLAKAETATFTFTVTKAMQGNPVNGTDVTLNSGEIYTLDAALNIFQVLFKIAGSYHFDIPTGYTYDTIGQDPIALINNSTTFTLNTGGAARMAGALENAKAAAAKALLAYNRVSTRAAGVGMFDLASWTVQAKLDFTDGLTKVTAALVGEYDIKDKLGAKIVTINATKFFTNPLTRANLPTFGYDVPRNATLSAKPEYNNAVAAERTVSNYYFNGTSYVANGTWKEAIGCSIVPTSDLPDYTLNGILPGNTAANNVAGFNGMLPVKGGVLIHGLVNEVPNYDIAEPNNNLSYESDGTSLFRLKQTVTLNTTTSLYQLSTRIQQIDIATGLSTNITYVAPDVNKIVHTTGQWWAGKIVNDASGQTFNLYKFSNVTTVPWTLNTVPDISIPLGYNSNVQAISGAGNSIYYALTKFDNYTKEIHKLDVATSADTLINSGSDWINAIEFYNGNLYTSGDNGIEKRDATTGAVVASYANGDFKAMLGGYFYTNNNGKLIKFAGTPAGGTAKEALAKYFGF